MSLYFRWISLLLLFTASFMQALEISEDDFYIYTKREFVDIASERQRELMHYFNLRVQAKLREDNIPTTWSEDAEKKLLGDNTRFLNIINDIKKRANSFALKHSISPVDLIPTGFILGIGIRGSGSYFVGMNGSALLTMIVVPLEVEEFDKLTGETSTYYEVSWNIGGIAQGGIGIGEGLNASFNGAIGIIWGDMPDSSELTGPGLGLSANVGAVQGLGVKAALVLNTTTRRCNLIAMATYAVGVQMTTEVGSEAFYFLNFEESLKFIFNKINFAGFGKEVINAAHLGTASSSSTTPVN